MTDTLLLGFSEYAAQARCLAAALSIPYAEVAVHRFPDEESMVRLPDPLPSKIILCRSLDHPNNKLIELLLAAETARAAGATELTLVAPYLCYMRQDKAFHPGEAISQRIIGRWLASLFDRVITVDPHLHRTTRLGDAVPAGSAISLSAAPLIANFLQGHVSDALLIGPDSESRQWVEQIATPGGLDYVIADKVRLSDRDVRITLPADNNIKNRTAVIVDDVASTAHTLATAARLLREHGATAVHCCVTHGLFIGDALPMLHEAGVEHIWSSDSIPHTSNAIALADLLASAVRD